MEIVSWLTAARIDATWPGVSPAIAEYIQAAQDAMEDAPRQKLLVLVPGLIGCAGEGDPPEIEAARCRLLARQSLLLLVPLVLEAGGWPQQAEAVRASAGGLDRMRAPLREAGAYARPNPLATDVIECALKVVASGDDKERPQRSRLSFRTAELVVSVIRCNHPPTRRLLLGERPRMRLLEFVEEAIITIIEEALGLVRKAPLFSDPWEVLEAGERFKEALAEGFAPAETIDLASEESPCRGRSAWAPRTSCARLPQCVDARASLPM